MWTCLFSLIFMQQAVHTDVRIEMKEFPGFSSEALCRKAGDALIKTHDNAATEPSDNYDASEHDNTDQPKEDQFELMRPKYTCFQVK